MASEESKYLEVARLLKKQIEDGAYYENRLLPSESELCLQHAVSRVTVREALALLEKEGLIIRLHGKGSLVPDTYYRYRDAGNKRLGMITYELSDEVFTNMVVGAQSACDAAGYELYVLHTPDTVRDKRGALLKMLDASVDGVIIDAMRNALPTPNADVYRRFDEAKLPVVFTNGYHDEATASRIMADDAACMERMVDLLVSLGHTRIGGIFASIQHQGLDRYRGYINGLRKHGLEYVDGRVLFATLGDLEVLFDTQINSVKPTFLDCTAIICYNDTMARYLENTLFRMGVYVPRDMSITGMDGLTLPSPTGSVLSSIAHPQQRMGERAVQVMLETLRTHHLQPNVVMSTAMIPGNTVAPPRADVGTLFSPRR